MRYDLARFFFEKNKNEETIFQALSFDRDIQSFLNFLEELVRYPAINTDFRVFWDLVESEEVALKKINDFQNRIFDFYVEVMSDYECGEKMKFLPVDIGSIIWILMARENLSKLLSIAPMDSISSISDFCRSVDIVLIDDDARRDAIRKYQDEEGARPKK